MSNIFIDVKFWEKIRKKIKKIYAAEFPDYQSNVPKSFSGVPHKANVYYLNF